MIRIRPYKLRNTLRIVRLAFATLVILAVCSNAGPIAAASNPVAAGDATTPGVLFKLSDKAVSKANIEIFKGVTPDKGNWQSILIAHLTPTAGDTVKDPKCTAVFVGRNALLTAAHCVLRGTQTKPAPINLQVDSYKLIFTCSVDIAYRDSQLAASPRMGADYALCVIGSLDPRPNSISTLVPDWIDVEPITSSGHLLATGFGCVSWTYNPSTDRYDPGAVSSKLTVGDVPVAAPTSGNDLIVSSSDGSTIPAVCSGDSGGPAYSGVSVANLGGSRSIRAVASSIDYHNITSRFALLGTPRFLQFLACWRGANPNSGILIRSSTFDPLIAPKSC